MVNQGRSLADLLESELDAGIPAEFLASTVRALRSTLDAIEEQRLDFNMRVVHGMWIRDLPSYKLEVELICETVEDPQTRNYMLDLLRNGENYHG